MRKMGYRLFEPTLEIHADATGDGVVPPIVDVSGVVAVRQEFKVAGFVGAFHVPFANVVAEAAADSIAVVEVGVWNSAERLQGRLEVWCVLWCPLGLDEDTLVRTKLVFEHHRGFQEFQVVAVKNQAGQLGMRLDNLANPKVESDRQIAPGEDGSAEDSVLVGMGRSIGRDPEFGAEDDVRASVFSVKQVD